MTLDTTPFWSPVSFAAISNGHWLVPPGDPLEAITGIGIDTRTLEPGQAYVAIAGERFDGHDFLAQARLAGARLALVERDPDADAALAPADDAPLAVLRVGSTVSAPCRHWPVATEICWARAGAA
jgi:UDP-N-acetylmuramyl pentapeptide synthase